MNRANGSGQLCGRRRMSGLRRCAVSRAGSETLPTFQLRRDPARVKAPPVPSARALVLLVLLAPLAVAIGASAPGAWVIAPVAAVGLLALTLIDGLRAGRLLDLKLDYPADVEVGQPLRLSLHAEFTTGGGRAAQAASDSIRGLARRRESFALEHGPVPDIRAGSGRARHSPARERLLARVGFAFGPLGLRRARHGGR